MKLLDPEGYYPRPNTPQGRLIKKLGRQIRGIINPLLAKHISTVDLEYIMIRTVCFELTMARAAAQAKRKEK